MKILTIESTCDETAAAVITDEFEILSSVVASQEQLHQKFNGVVPEIAARAHVERILPVINETLERASIGLTDLDAVAVANEPGLAGSLLVGVVAAKALCLAHDIPLVAVNHLQAHIFACRLAAEKNVFPCVGLIVSGGHSNSISAILHWTSPHSEARLMTLQGKHLIKLPRCWDFPIRAVHRYPKPLLREMIKPIHSHAHF